MRKVLTHAAGYPDRRTEIGPDDYRFAKSRNLRLFVEYPSFIPGQNPVGETYHGKFDDALAKLADVILRAQVHSDNHPDITRDMDVRKHFEESMWMLGQ